MHYISRASSSSTAAAPESIKYSCAAVVQRGGCLQGTYHCGDCRVQFLRPTATYHSSLIGQDLVCSQPPSMILRDPWTNCQSSITTSAGRRTSVRRCCAYRKGCRSIGVGTISYHTILSRTEETFPKAYYIILVDIV